MVAAGHFRRAVALDSSYVGAKTALAFALEEVGDCRGVDSIARLLEPVRSRLAPVDRGSLDGATALCHGDLDGAIEASRTVVAAAPSSVGSRIIGAVRALEAFRPREALRFLHPLAARRHELTGTPASMYGYLLGKAYHMAGDYGRELRETGGGSALAGLGRIDAAQALLTDTLLRSTESEADPQGALCLALEVRAHGHPREGLAMVRRVSGWFAAHPAVDPVPEGKIPCLWLLLSSRYYTRRFGRGAGRVPARPGPRQHESRGLGRTRRAGGSIGRPRHGEPDRPLAGQAHRHSGNGRVRPGADRRHSG